MVEVINSKWNEIRKELVAIYKIVKKYEEDIVLDVA